MDSRTRDLYVRQLWDQKGSAIVGLMAPRTMAICAHVCVASSRAPTPAWRLDRDRRLSRRGQVLRRGDRGLRQGLRRPGRGRLRGLEAGGCRRSQHGRTGGLDLRWRAASPLPLCLTWTARLSVCGMEPQVPCGGAGDPAASGHNRRAQHPAASRQALVLSRTPQRNTIAGPGPTNRRFARGWEEVCARGYSPGVRLPAPSPSRWRTPHP